MFSIEKIGGVDCIFAPMEDSHSITIKIYCKAGSYYEDEKHNGISHFLEHMFFKGGKKYQTPKEVSLAIDKIGGDFNAFTSEEKVAYYVRCAPNYRETAFDVLSDMMVFARFDTEEMEKEKGVVIQELKMYEDEPRDVLEQNRGEWFFGKNNYGRSVIGTVENILNFNQDMLFEFKNQLYTKDNLFIVVAGKILEGEKLKKKIDQTFSLLPDKKTLEKIPFTGYSPQEHESFFEKGVEQSHLIISAKGFDYMQNQKYSAKVLSTILGGNTSSLLYQKIREELGLCYYVYSTHQACNDFGNFLICAGIDKEKRDFGIGKLYEMIEKTASGQFSKEQYDDALSYLNGSFQMGLESPYEVASFLGNQFVYKLQLESLEEVLNHLLNVSYEEVVETAKMLKKENLYLYYLK